MKLLFFGAGAIGAYIGGSLALTGCDVAFVERPEPAEILRREGLVLSLGAHTHTHHLPLNRVFTSASDALRDSTPDLAVFALKSYDTGAAIESLQPLAGRLPPALCLQNGVENEAALESVFGSGRVIAGTVTSAVGRGRAGEITLERKRGLGLAAGHALSLPLVHAMNRAGLNARLYPMARAMKWSKLFTNLTANASSAILGMTPQAVFSDPRLFELERKMLRECLQVMRTGGIDVVNLPGTPVRMLAFAVKNLPRGLAQPLLTRAIGGGRGGKMPSFYLDLNSGRGKTEVEWLNGAVVREGERLGIAAPVNHMLTETLTGLAKVPSLQKEFFEKPEALIRLFEAGGTNFL
ncbi:MAG: 2-dehydropantoate 2-reductase [Anaerolineales bacterium]